MQRSMLAVASLVSAAGLSAQVTVVSPSPFLNVPGPSSNAHPFGAAQPGSTTMRYMSIHDDTAGRIGVIRGLSLRHNEGVVSQATNVTLELRISTAASLASAAVTTFDTNHGADKMTVVPPSSQFNFPAYPIFTPGPTPFLLSVPFTNLFVYLGTGGLAWETLISSRTNTLAFQLDAASPTTFNLFGVNLGTGCLATGRTVTGTSTLTYAAGNATFSGANLTGSAPGALVLGASTSLWNGIPLPFDLPGTTGYPSGTCRVYCDWLVALPGTSSAAGALSQAVPFVVGPGTLGIALYHYAFTLDSVANAFGAVTTNARYSLFGDGKAFGGCRIYSYNDVNAAVGTKDSTIVVTGFQF